MAERQNDHIAQVDACAETAGTRCWSATETQTALDMARKAPGPSRLDEEWRKTDPDAFPWAQLAAADPAQTRRETHVQALGLGEATGLVPLAAIQDTEQCRGLQVVAGDDYDAKFLYYHRAFSRTPACFRIPRNFQGDPVAIVQRASGAGLAAFTTILIIEPGADVTLYDRWEAADDVTAAIGRTEIVVREGARLTLVQDDRIAADTAIYRRGRVRLEKAARLLWCSATQGAKWHVARMEAALVGSGAEAIIKGLFMGTGERRAEHRTHQYHAAPQARSELMFKTLLSGQSHSVYQGLISVPRPAQQTDAYQQCRNLLLNSGTHADAIPKLEIIADDVRCTHGASMGSINKEQLFYLQSRGLNRQQAKTAVATGFAEEIIRYVPLESVQQRWRGMVAEAIGELP